MKENTNKRLILESLILYISAVALIYASKLQNLVRILPEIVILVMFLLLPYIIIEVCKRDFKEYGLDLSASSVKRNIVIGLGASIIILPAFSALYVIAAKIFDGMFLIHIETVKSLGYGTVTRKVMRVLLYQVMFTGITEEVFFRSYIQTNLNRVFGKKWSLLNVRFGPSLFITSFFFGIIHIVWWGNPLGALVIIPGIAFGLLREMGNSFVAPAIFHGFCNTTIFVLSGSVLVM